MKTAFEKDSYRFTISNTTTEIDSHEKLKEHNGKEMRYNSVYEDSK